MCAPHSELPSNISTMVWMEYRISIIQIHSDMYSVHLPNRWDNYYLTTFTGDNNDNIMKTRSY